MTEPSEIFDAAIKAAVATTQSLASLQEPLLRSARLIEECLGSGHKLLVCGNGGSAADAADFATEFACRFMHDRRPYPAMNLAQGGSLTTAIGNDYGFEEIFARQVTAFGERGDVLVAITTSGNSRNVMRAIEEAGADWPNERRFAWVAMAVPTKEHGRHRADRARRFDRAYSGSAQVSSARTLRDRRIAPASLTRRQKYFGDHAASAAAGELDCRQREWNDARELLDQVALLFRQRLTGAL